MVCDSVLRYVVACSTDPSTLLRLEYWLQHTLFEGLISNCHNLDLLVLIMFRKNFAFKDIDP